MAFVNIAGNADPILALSSSGTGPGATVFTHDQGVEFNCTGALYPAVFELAITDIVGSFSGLQVNLEWSPISPDMGTAQFQTVAVWLPLATPVTFLPCSATGIYRLNCTTFTGGTSFNVYVSIASAMPQGAGGSGGGGVVTQGTIPWIVAGQGTPSDALANPTNAVPVEGFTLGWDATNTVWRRVQVGAGTGALQVAVVSGGGGGTQFVDNAASGATPTGTLSMGWDSVNSKIRALKVDASQNLLVDVSNASIAVTGTFFQATQPVSIAAAIDVSDRAARLLGVVAGATTPADSFANPTDAEDTFALLGGWDATNAKWRRVQVDAATGTLKVDPGTVAVTGTFFQATQPVSIAANQAVSGSLVDVTNSQVAGGGTTAPTKVLMVGGKTNDGTAQYDIIPLGASGRSVIVEGIAGGTAVPISGSVSVSNFPATYDVSDRAARLLGVVYGSQAQQLVQTPTNFNLKVELAAGATLYDARSIRALTSADVVSAVQGTAAALSGKWPVQITDGTNTMPTGDASTRGVWVRLEDGLGNVLTTNSSTNIGTQIALDSNILSIRGTLPTQAGFLDAKISDGTNGTVAVKAASVAAVATDPALVVAISPNNPITTTSSLPPNAAQETGGNLALLYTMSMNLVSILAQLKLLNLNLASSMPSAYVDQDTTLLDIIPTLN